MSFELFALARRIYGAFRPRQMFFERTISASSQILGTRPAFDRCSDLRRGKRSASLHRLLNEFPDIPQVLLGREDISQSDSHDRSTAYFRLIEISNPRCIA